MSFWNDSTGKKVESANEFDKGSGDFEIIPAKTQVKAIIEEAKWSAFNKGQDSGESYIDIKWAIIDGQYKGRKIFQKIRPYNKDAKKRDKEIRMLGAIDSNCGGDLQKVDGEPATLDLMRALCNRPMAILLQVWDMDGKRGNWVSAVAPLHKADSTKTENEKLKTDDIGWG